jgi:hypothetical protein
MFLAGPFPDVLEARSLRNYAQDLGCDQFVIQDNVSPSQNAQGFYG